jgi:hypothetical protein
MLTMIFAGAVLSLLGPLGIAVRSNPGVCPEDSDGGYTVCGFWQDLRSVISFVLGALLTCCFGDGSFKSSDDNQTREAREEVPEEESNPIMEKFALCASLL